MHASPALVVWALRWTRAPSELAASTVPAEAAKFGYATFAELVGCTMTMYSVWAVLYYFKVGIQASPARSLQPSEDGWIMTNFTNVLGCTAGVCHFGVQNTGAKLRDAVLFDDEEQKWNGRKDSLLCAKAIPGRALEVASGLLLVVCQHAWL
jgi:hypothetical protein